MMNEGRNLTILIPYNCKIAYNLALLWYSSTCSVVFSPWKWSRSVMSDSLRPHGLPIRLLRPWDFLGKSAGVDCHFLLQGIFPTQELNPGLPHCRQTLYCLSHQWMQPSNSFFVIKETHRHVCFRALWGVFLFCVSYGFVLVEMI